jgi:hypothetical protein
VEYWRVTDSELGIVITCVGHDREGTVGLATKAFDAFAKHRMGRFRIVADLRQMTGYETVSREAWQKVFFAHRKRIESLVLVGARSAFIRMGAATVGAFAGIPVRFVSTMDDLAQFDNSA